MILMLVKQYSPLIYTRVLESTVILPRVIVQVLWDNVGQ